MFYVSDIKTEKPEKYSSDLQKQIYNSLEMLNITFERVETDEAITMDDCVEINKKLNMNMVKTLFLCNRQKTNFYLFITKGDKPFNSKNFSTALKISRVSFAPPELMNDMLKTKIGAATVLSCLIDNESKVQIVFDSEITKSESYGCSDSTTTGYMKLHTDDVINKFLPFTHHKPIIIEI